MEAKSASGASQPAPPAFLRTHSRIRTSTNPIGGGLQSPRTFFSLPVPTSSFLRLERLVLRHTVDEDRLVIDPVELIGDLAVDGDLDCARGQFWNNYSNRRGSNRE